MPKKYLKLIIALFAALAFAALNAGRHKNRRTIPSPEKDDDWIEYPKVRAHVYFATMEEYFNSMHSAVSSFPDAGIAIRPDGSYGLSFSDGQCGKIDLKVHCQRLGARHIRVVVEPDNYGPAGVKTIEAITAFQHAMDALLSGG
jgi:hypothetical protein